MTIKPLLSVALLLLTILLVSCAPEVTESQLQQAVAIESSDQCHLCGMMILEQPGPKGEMFSKNDPQVKKFCSARELFAFYLQPENQHRMEALYVHDMAVTPWDAPDDDAFIDARTAHYVYGSEKQASMGLSLASFSDRAAAQAFVERYGGELLSFDQISLELLQKSNMSMNADGMASMTSADAMVGAMDGSGMGH